jgi:hypothetical protein
VASVLWDSVRTASHRRSRKYAEVVWRMGFSYDERTMLRSMTHVACVRGMRAARVSSRSFRTCWRGRRGMSLNPASGFADTAISVYCPDGYIDHP